MCRSRWRGWFGNETAFAVRLSTWRDDAAASGASLTLEHRVPFAFGGLPTVENLCLHCAPHNAYTAREEFGQALLERKRAQRKRACANAKGKANAEATAGARPARAADVNERALSALVLLRQIFHGGTRMRTHP